MYKIAGLAAIVFILTGCSNESTSTLTDNTIIDNATYTEHVKSIIDNNCIMCHASTPQNGAPMSLTTFENVRDAVQNRGLIGRISLPQGAPGMMPNGGQRLPQNAIDLIAQWEEQGLQE